MALLRAGVARAWVVVQAYARMQRFLPCLTSSMTLCQHDKTIEVPPKCIAVSRFSHVSRMQRALMITCAFTTMIV